MNPILSFVERIAIGAEVDEIERPLIDFRNDHTLSQRDLCKSVLIMASPDSGKTTLARTLYRGMLRRHYGGLVLCVKQSQIDEFLSSARLEEREDDCIVVTAGGLHTFNPLAHENNVNEAAALIGELTEVVADKIRGGDNDSFWKSQLLIILRNLFALCELAYGKFDVVKAAELFDGRANSSTEIFDPTWQETSSLAIALRMAKKCMDDVNIGLAVEYFERTFPSHGDRLQGSLAATVSSVLDYLRRPPLRALFAGESTFAMEDLLNGGKICIVGLPVLDSVDGKIANALLQFCFCRAASRPGRKNFAFLISDECQETVSSELASKLAVLRESKIATILLTQNLAVLDQKIGLTARQSLCALLETKIFGGQNHAETRQWAAEQIGKRKVPVETKTTGSNSGERGSGRNASKSVGEQWDYRVPPLRFAELEVGETICLRREEVWRARWHKDKPGKCGTVRIV